MPHSNPHSHFKPHANAQRLPVGSFPWRALVLVACLYSGLHASCMAAPDEALLGKAQGYPVAPSFAQAYQEAYRVGSFSAMDRISPHCVIAPSAQPQPLPRAPVEPALRYFFDGAAHSLDDYMQRQRATAVLVLKDGAIVAERSSYGRRPEDRMLSNSMAKTLLALAIGKALEAGHIRALEDRADTYATELAGTLYGETRIIDLLRMASGARYVEDYSGHDDHARFSKRVRSAGLRSAAQTITERAAPAGTVFNYASAESQILGQVLRAATGQSICRFFSEQLWQPLGAESPATWLTNPVDQTEIVSGNFNATVHDYARLGLLLANDGQREGQAIVSRDYLLRMTDPAQQPPAFRPGQLQINGSRYFGYGLQTWLLPSAHRQFALLGIYGQAILVDPELRLVMVHLAVGKDAASDQSGHRMDLERDALWRGLVAHYGRWQP
jgi:CubicO group peptidase (beta-lactamase class C family)